MVFYDRYGGAMPSGGTLAIAIAIGNTIRQKG
jgi:hypothetical protein